MPAITDDPIYGGGGGGGGLGGGGLGGGGGICMSPGVSGGGMLLHSSSCPNNCPCGGSQGQVCCVVLSPQAIPGIGNACNPKPLDPTVIGPPFPKEPSAPSTFGPQPLVIGFAVNLAMLQNCLKVVAVEVTYGCPAPNAHVGDEFSAPTAGGPAIWSAAGVSALNAAFMSGTFSVKAATATWDAPPTQSSLSVGDFVVYYLRPSFYPPPG